VRTQKDSFILPVGAGSTLSCAWFSASPVAADGKLYLSNEDGSIAIVAADRTFRYSRPTMFGEPIMATPALSRGVMFVRTMNSARD
jgi:hypothetical protein